MFVKRIRFLFSLCCILLVGLPLFAAHADSPNKKVLDIQHWTTNNGARVYFVQRSQLPMVDIQVVFDAGSARDGNRYGLAQMTNAMLEEGTKDLSADQIAKSFDEVGALYGSNVDRDIAAVSLRSLTEENYLKQALKTFTDLITHPRFSQKAFSRVRKQILRAIEQQQQSPYTVAKNLFYQMLYGKQPYGHPVLGTNLRVSSLTRANVQQFFKRYYVAKNAIIVMVGDLSRNQATEIANQMTSKMAEGKVASPLPPVKASEAPIMKTRYFPSAQTALFMGEVGIDRKDPDYFALKVGNYTLGGAAMISRLYQQLREERGLVYGTGSVFLALKEKGPFALIAQSRTEKAEEALTVARETLATFVKEGPTKKEIKAAKENIIGGFPLLMSSNSNMIGLMTVIAFYHLPLDYLDTYRANIKSVTREQIREAFQRHIALDKMVTVMVGNNKKPKEKPKGKTA